MADLGVVLLNLGAPETLDDVEPYLRNLFSDPYILEFPFGLRWLRTPLAKRIAKRRAPESRENYAKIGGGSPLNRYTTQQAAALEAELAKRGHSAKVVFAQRAWKPRAEVAAAALAQAGIKRGVMLPLYPQFARVTTQSAFEDFDEAWESAGARGVSWKKIRSYPAEKRYLEAVSADIRLTLEQVPAERRATTALFFSAHGLPLRAARHPQETYPAEVKATVNGVLAELGWTGRTHTGFQSRVGPVKWLEPFPEAVIDAMVAEKTTDAVVYPVAFVSDHSETLYELDMQYGDIARAKGLSWHRVPALNDRPLFNAALADLVERVLQE
jgi:protoporphyrin/coproporphyrin ferrochelatase